LGVRSFAFSVGFFATDKWNLEGHSFVEISDEGTFWCPNFEVVVTISHLEV